MDLKEAFTYLSEHYQLLINTNATVLGVAYMPDDSDAEFYIIELSLDQEAKEEEGIDYYNVHLEGGNLLSSEGVEDHLDNEDIDKLIQDLPEFTKNI